MLKFGIEFLGTFIFLSVILAVGQPIPIAVALLAMIYLGGNISGGHFNPAVSTMMFMDGRMDMNDFIGYVVAQLAGAAAALYFHKYLKQGGAEMM
jgi:aquaporin Z